MPFFKPKILVEIIDESGIKEKKKFVIEENTVVIREGRRGKGGQSYKPRFDRDCIIDYKIGIWPFKRRTRKLMLMDGAGKCISFKNKTKKSDIPFWNRIESERLFKAGVIKAAGASYQKVEISPILYVMIAANIILTVFTLFIASGRVRFA